MKQVYKSELATTNGEAAKIFSQAMGNKKGNVIWLDNESNYPGCGKFQLPDCAKIYEVQVDRLAGIFPIWVIVEI